MLLTWRKEIFSVRRFSVGPANFDSKAIPETPAQCSRGRCRWLKPWGPCRDCLLAFDDLHVVKDSPELEHLFLSMVHEFTSTEGTPSPRLILIGRELPPKLEFLASPPLSGLNETDALAFLEARDVRLSPADVERLRRLDADKPNRRVPSLQVAAGPHQRAGSAESGNKMSNAG